MEGKLGITYEAAVAEAVRKVRDPYARAYLLALPQARAEYGEEGERAQLLYALENMKEWRGRTASLCKAAMRKRAGTGR